MSASHVLQRLEGWRPPCQFSVTVASCGGSVSFTSVLPAYMGTHGVGYVSAPDSQRPTLIRMLLELIVVATINHVSTSITGCGAAPQN